MLRVQIEPEPLRSGSFRLFGGGRMDDDALLTLTEASERLGVSKPLIIDWAKRGRIERHGRRYRWRYRWADLVRVEAETRNCATPNAFARKPQLIEA